MPSWKKHGAWRQNTGSVLPRFLFQWHMPPRPSCILTDLSSSWWGAFRGRGYMAPPPLFLSPPERALWSGPAWALCSLLGESCLMRERTSGKALFFPNSPLGNKADVRVSVGLSPLSSLSQRQTLEEPEEEHRESWVLSDTDTAPKDKCFGASEQKRQHVAGHTEGAVFPLRAWRQASQGRRSLAPSRCKCRSVILVDKWTLSQGDATRMITARLNLLK